MLVLFILQKSDAHPIDYAEWVGAIAAVVIIPITIWGIIASRNKAEQQKLVLKVLPRLFVEGIEYKGYNGEIAIILRNKGETAYVTNVKYTSGDIYLYPAAVPFDIDKQMRKYLSIRFKDPTRTTANFQIEIFYDNTLNQHYHAVINGKDGSINITLQEPLK